MDTESKNLSTLILDALRVKGLTIEKLSQITGISERPLVLLIEDKFDQLPSAPYVHGYLMKIAEVLGLDGPRLWKDYLKNHEAIKRSGEKDRLPTNRFAVPRLGQKKFWIAALILVLILYASYRVFNFYRRAELDLPNLNDNLIVQESAFNIAGKTNPDNQLTINNEFVYPDQDGNFTKTISLNPGFNTLTFKVKKILGRETTIIKQIFYQPPQQETSQNIFPANGQ